jgi:hypothetical protein
MEDEKMISRRKSIWLTYAWRDNEDKNVDYVAQELQKAGLDVKLDRWDLTAGKRLWEQIGRLIQDPSESDSWLMYATQTSLGSQACKEEFAYALDRALHTRGGDFPVIALFAGSADEGLIPAGIKTRLFVSLTDPDWKERIVSAVEKRQPRVTRSPVDPYFLKIHKLDEQHQDNYAIEVRPRAGTWAPFFAAIPLSEKDHVSPHLSHGPAKHIPQAYILIGCGEVISEDGKWWVVYAGNEATPTQSYYLLCKELPSSLMFGVNESSSQYHLFLVKTTYDNSETYILY